MRIYIPDMTEFFAWMDRVGQAYAVLRGFQHFDHGYPAHGAKEDVDLLVADAALPLIVEKYGATRKSKGVKCDLYSVTGAQGGGYLGQAYMPAALAREVLDGRRLWKNIFYVPGARAHLLSLLYHITYQKAGLSKLPMEGAGPSKYQAEIDSLTTELGIDLPHSLSAFHDFLKTAHFSATPEVLAAYVQNDYARAVKMKGKGHKHVQPFYCRLFAEQKGEMNMFVIRDIAIRTGTHEKFIEMLRQHYEIMLIKKIPWLQKLTQSRKMRGGKWSRGGKPGIVVLVYDRDPIATSSEDRKIHPYVFNNRQFVKRGWREWFTQETGSKPSANPIHSTDNEAEAVAHLPLFFSETEQQEIFHRLAEIRSGHA